MSTKSFVWTLFFCMLAGGIFGVIVGDAVGFGLPDAFPANDPFKHSLINAGIVYGLAFGVALGMAVGMFYIWWKSWAIKNMIHRWSISEDPEGNWIEWKPGCLHIVGTILLVPIALLAVLIIATRSVADRVPLSAYSDKEGLTIRYYGFQPISVIGAYRVEDPSKVYTFKYPRLYRNKGTCHCEEAIPWKQLMPAASDQKAAADDGSRWELLYVRCQDTANR